MDEVIQQLKNYFDSKHISQKEIADTMGVKPQYINAIFGGRRSIGHKIADMFEEKYNISKIWLLTGKGEMLVAEKSTPEPKYSPAAIPFFEDFEFGCSPSGFDGALVTNKTTGYIMLPGLNADDDTFVVPARGDSMVNVANPERSIPNGALVAVRKMRLSTPRWGEVYALATADGCIIKRLYPSERDGYVRCVSFNSEEYPPFELETREIYDIGNVVAVVSVKLWA